MTERTSRDWLWAYACEIIIQAESLRGSFLRPLPRKAGEPAWQAPADVFETDTELVVIVALPGVPPDSVDIGLDDGQLSVRGERRLPLTEGTLLRQVEIPHGRFERRLTLPPGRYRLAERTMADGCLRLSFHKLG
ncbi:MAG: Hsp20/alpha crystallin family protein [Magnetospirillum sp.]|nr:Hsp20/alpha crystallin family protein [Magnetospirillum sp.]